MANSNASTAKSPGLFGATLLVTGCCIGAGMIGLPVSSALAGFMPATVAMFLCYVFTTLTGLLLLEATLWFDERVNLPTIVEKTLGKTGKSITLLLFLFLFYCLFVAYLDGGGVLFSGILSYLFHSPMSREIGIFACLGFVAAIAYTGAHMVVRLNRFLFLGLIISYVVLVAIGLPQITQENLTRMNLTHAVGTIPILLICFGFQNLVPSMTYYLKKNVNHLRFAFMIGNLIPFFIYLIWNFVILGMLTDGAVSANGQSTMIAEMLQQASPSVSIILVVKAFSLFAILTSFIPNALTFVDFLKDGFKHQFKELKSHKTILFGLVFVPPLICTLFYPDLFLRALEFAGGFIDVLLFGILPATVILIGRNIKKMSGPYQVAGGNALPALILLISVVILFLK